MKVLVRHAMGAGGWFICGLIYSMLEDTDIEVTKNGSGHNLGFMYETHNLDRLVQGPLSEKFWYYSEEEFNNKLDISEGVDWFKQNLKFSDKGLVGSWHIMRTHARNLNPLVYSMGINNVKVINIHHAEEELDQMIYNFVYKTIFTESQWIKKHDTGLIDDFRYHFPDQYTNVTQETLLDAIANKDAKFLTWFLKLCWKRYWERYPQYQPPTEFNVFDMHWHEIATGSLADRLTELSNFLGVSLSERQLERVKKSILDYTKLQKPIPFIL